MVTLYVLPPILKPLLYGVVCWTFEITKLSAAPNPASAPVSGWIQPIVISPLAPDPDADEAPDPPLAPLILELHASSSPPPPTTAALIPAIRSRPRRLNSAGRGDDPPRPPGCFSRGDPSPRTPLGRDPSPQTPLASG